MSIDMFEHCCCGCGVVFMVTKSYDIQLRSSKKSFFCPNGHILSYKGDTDTQKLARAEKLLGASRDYEKAACDREKAARRSNAALRGVITKMKKKL